MPEICEVEIIKEQLNNAIGGEHLLSYSVNKPLHKSDGKLLEIPCHKVTAIERWAKYLYFRMPGGIIESHLGMSGAWLMANTLELSYFIEEMEEQAATLAEKHIRYILNFTGSVSLIYYDARGFGSFYYYYCTEEDLYPTPDILNPKFDFKGLAIWNKDKPIYKYLHDQEIFPGMGAYLGAEWLFACNIHPMTSCSSIKDLPFLAKQLKKVLRWANGHTRRQFY